MRQSGRSDGFGRRGEVRGGEIGEVRYARAEPCMVSTVWGGGVVEEGGRKEGDDAER